MVNNKVLISGAGSGLGQALALRYAEAGAEVCVADVDSQGGRATVEAIEQAGGQAFFIACDITQQLEVDKLASQLTERWQSLDVLINNAGVASAGALDTESMEQWQWITDINLLGHVRMTKAMLGLLQDSHVAHRSIINIASQAGLTGAPKMGSYCTTKAALVAYSEVAHLELAEHGIHVAVACPAFLNTNLNNSLRSGDPSMQQLLNKLIKQSGVSADSIAEIIMRDVAAKKFIILTHKESLSAYRLKRFLPIERYLKMVQKRLQKYANK